MDENETIYWLENVWNKRQGGLLKIPAMLIWDIFRAHKTDDVKKLDKKINTSLAVILGGLTSVWQPLDVSLNKPFKDKLRNMWSKWMIFGTCESTKGGNLKNLGFDLVDHWV